MSQDAMSSGTGVLAGRVALVTGALGGLGTAIVDELVAEGAHVAIHHLGQGEEARRRVTQLKDKGHVAAAVEADVTDWDAVAVMVADMGDQLGPIDVLVNNAGFMAPVSFVDMTLDDWHRTIDVDLTGVFVCSRHVVADLVSRGAGGSIVNVSSQLAFKGAYHYSSYCAAKAGVVGLTRAMARELGPQIRVNAIAPGPVDTAFIAPYATDEWRRERTRDSVIGRLALPEEVAPAVAFLASPAAELFHGQTLHLNGGGVMT